MDSWSRWTLLLGLGASSKDCPTLSELGTSTRFHVAGTNVDPVVFIRPRRVPSLRACQQVESC